MRLLESLINETTFSRFDSLALALPNRRHELAPGGVESVILVVLNVFHAFLLIMNVFFTVVGFFRLPRACYEWNLENPSFIWGCLILNEAKPP